MSKHAFTLGLLVFVAALASPPAQVQGQPKSAGVPPGGEAARTFTFDSDQALADWTTTGDVSIDRTKGRNGTAGALKVGPGAKALLKLRDQDESGQVEFWVYDDGATPENPKLNRPGPRWGLVQNDGRLFAVGILYASYLGGTEGYTATACDGRDWFDQLFWLGVNRAPAGWQKWTFVFDTEKGIQILHADQNGKPTRPPQFDKTKAGLRGFSAIAIWGDSGAGKGQALWVDDVAVTLGGPVKSVPKPRPTAPRVVGPNLWAPSTQTIPIYTQDHPPATPTDLPLKAGVSQYGITWTFDKPTRVGQFINGDCYVVGPVTIQAITPKPLYGAEIPEIELDHMDLERPVDQRVRHGFMLNPPAAMRVSYDSGVRNWFVPSLIQKLPVTMKAGDSLVSTISLPKGLVLKPMLWETVERGVDDSTPIRTAAVLTCVAEPLPPDAFRPAFCDRQAKVYLSRNLKRNLLPTAAAKNPPDIGLYVRFTQRPWVGTGFFGFEGPVENMPQYGRDYARVVGQDALLLCTDLAAEKKEPLLVDFVQVGIDLGGMIRAGHPGWEGFGGHGSGRKLPIVFAGLLLGDDQLANVNKFFPAGHFSEDEQTAYGDAWTGAKVVFTGHRAIDEATGVARAGTGPYEHTPPSTWKEGREKLSESYRRCCTSAAWVAEALALRLMKAEQAWDHDAFFDYCDRWMFEDETEALKTLKKDAAMDQPDWAHEGRTWEAFVDEMWAAHRTAPGMPPTDGWKKQHDDSYLKTALEKARSAPK